MTILRGAFQSPRKQSKTGRSISRESDLVCSLITVFDFLIAKWGLTEFVTECLTSFMTFALNVFHFFDSGLCLCLCLCVRTTVKRHVVECSGPKVLHYVMLSAGSYEEADKYIQETIEKGRTEENWNQDYHDECSKIAEGLAKDIASIESFIEKDKNSEIEG